MVISRTPGRTSAPSRKCTASTAPATRERTSTRSTASRRPENSSHNATSCCSTTATETGTAAAAAAGELLDWELVLGNATRAATATKPATKAPTPQKAG